MNQAAIRTDGLRKTFGSEVAVDNVTFEIPPGTIFGFVGPSGSGKTTTVRLLTGVYAPTAGEAWVLGRRPTQFTQSTRERIGYLPQFFVLYPELTVWENMNFAASLYGVRYRRAARLRELLDFVELADDRSKLARNISGGMQRRLSLAATLVHNPELIFLDEPTAGVDPVLRRKFWDYFRDLQAGGRTLFVTTQYVSEAAYCDIVGVMRGDGRMIRVDSPDALRRAAYHGEMIDLRLTSSLTRAQAQEMTALPFVRRPPEYLDVNSLRLVVDEAGTAMPALLHWATQRRIDIESIQEYLPPFDDVFVELLKAETDNA